MTRTRTQGGKGLLRALILTLAATMIGITALVLLSGNNGRHASPVLHAEARFTMTNGLLVTSRDRFRLCVETSPSLVGESAHIRETIARVLSSVRRHPDWARAGYGHQAPGPVMGCPGAVFPSKILDDSAVVGPGMVTSPGPYRTAVLVLDDEKAKAVLGRSNAVIAEYESMCDGPVGVTDRNCGTVTTALVVRARALEDPASIWDQFTLAVGLDPKGGPKTTAQGS